MFTRLMVWLIGKYFKKKLTVLSVQTVINDDVRSLSVNNKNVLEELVKRELISKIVTEIERKGLMEIEWVHAPHLHGRVYRTTVLILERFL